jgi:hypothetical protein
MAKSVRNALLLAKAQPTVDVDPTATAGANAILAGNVTIQAIEAEFADRSNIQPYFGNQGSVAISQKSTISFDVELAGAGALGTVPGYAPLLKACAFGETINAGVSVVYAPITAAIPMVAITFFMDGLKFLLLNARGNVEFALSARGIPMMKYTYTGSFALPTDVAVPSGAVFTAFQAPLGVNKANSPTFTLHGVSPKTQDFNVNINNQVVYRNLIGSESILITDRKPSGSVSIETESVAFKDWYSAVRLGTLSTLQMVHGTVAGNTVQIDAPKVQLINPQMSEADGISMTSMDLNLLPNAGNDEFVLTVK